MDRNLSTQAASHTIDAYVEFACRHGGRYREEPNEAVLTDLLSDLRHYCAEHGVDFERAVKLSRLHFRAEEVR